MKIKLTPELSYIIGLWRKARSYEGLGVKGNPDLLEIFSKEALEKELTTSDKLLSDEDKVYFYHSAYRKFFQDVEKEQLQRFKYLNEYAANYLAGLFDSAGSIDSKGILSLDNMSRQDELMLLRLGFLVKRRGKTVVIEKPLLFLAFIKKYVKVKKDHKAFEYIKSSSAK